MLNPLVDVMHAYPKHVCPLDHIHVVIILIVLSLYMLILSMYDPLNTSIIIPLVV
jgi:hypothetical protein